MCPAGSEWVQANACSTCIAGEYASAIGTVACKACPSFSTTSNQGATSIDACECVHGFYRSINDAGSMVCTACPEGGTTSESGSTSVDQCICQQGRFPTTNTDGTTSCIQCKDVLEFSTTLEGGSSIDDCVCNQNYYLEANATSRKCMACDPTLMDCSITGITLANMPIKPGGWRLSNATSTVYVCFNPDACVGIAVAAGSNASQSRRRLSSGASPSTAGNALCAPGHTGFLCGTCIDDWCVGACMHAGTSQCPIALLAHPPSRSTLGPLQGTATRTIRSAPSAKVTWPSPSCR